MAKNLKKLISMILALAMCLSIIATPAAASDLSGNEEAALTQTVEVQESENLNNEIPAEESTPDLSAEIPEGGDAGLDSEPVEDGGTSDLPLEIVESEDNPNRYDAGWGGFPSWGDNDEEENEEEEEKKENTQNSDKYEWYQVYLQGKLIASGQGAAGNTHYLGTSYKAGISTNGPMLTWYIHPKNGNSGNFGTTIDMRSYITIPDGYTVADYTVEESSIDGINNDSSAYMYDNAIIKITIKTLLDENKQEVEIEKVTSVTVNHFYRTYDIYTGETVLDGSTTSSEGAEVGDIYTAVAVPSYKGNAYEQQTEDGALTITLVADAASNVINIEYLRTVDTTPAETAVTVNHIYKTYDAYTKQTTEDGRTTSSEAATEGDVYTAAAVPSYNGNAYEQQTEDGALTITLVADAASNVINIEYLRTVDTTPAETAVTVNHIYKTHDAYTKQTTEDGRTTSSEAATEGDVYTAAAVPSYNGNAYEQQTADSALTITVVADAASNVINIEYLRTVDTTPVDYEPVLTVTKIADRKGYKEGDTVTWTITVKNISAYTAYNVKIADDLTGESWIVDALAPGAAQSFTATMTNVAAGMLSNVAEVTWTDNDEIPDSEEPDEIKSDEDEEVLEIRELIDNAPALTVTKTADRKSYKAGDTVTWTITVKNISAYTAYNVKVADDLTGESWTVEALAPGAEQSFTATMANVASGTLKNIAEVTWEDNDEIPDEKEPEEPKETKDDEIINIRELIDYAPVLSVVKTAGKAVYEAGETITWTITVKNISEYTAYNVNIVDELTGDRWSIRTLAPGAEKSFTTSLENAQPGSIKNVAVVTWEDGDEIPDEEETEEIRTTSDEELVGINDPKPENYTPVLNVTKVAGKKVYGYGETIIWTITVKNVSEYPAYNVVIVDDLTGDRWTIDVLGPGAEESFLTSLANAEPGTVRNVAVVTWEDGDEIPDEEETNEIKTTNDEEIVEKEEPVDYAPVLTLVKTADKETYEVGETITWTINVMNISEHSAHNITVVDELTGDEWFIDELAPGRRKVFTVSVENAAAGTVKNVVVASWTDNDEIPDEEEEEIKTADDEEIVSVVEPPNPAPVLRIIKTSSKYRFTTGETVTWYISVENISEYTAYEVVVVDELTKDRWYVGTLEPGAARTFAATTQTAAAGSITNVAVVTWTDGDETPDAEETDEVKRGSDDALVIVEDPAPTVDPTPNVDPIPQNDDGDIIIEDEDVPLADAPKTGDISGVLAAISLLSFGGMVLLKKKED